MKAFYKIFLASLLACGVVAVSAEQAIPQHSIEVKSYVNSEKGYSLQYPSDWKKNDVPQLDLVLFAPSKASDQSPQASMNIVSEKVGSGINVEQFYSESASNLTSALKEVRIEKTGASDFNSIPSKWILYTHVMQGVTFKVLQYFIVANETIYLMTFSASEDHFENYRQEFEKIAQSFKITKEALVAPNQQTSSPKIEASAPGK